MPTRIHQCQNQSCAYEMELEAPNPCPSCETIMTPKLIEEVPIIYPSKTYRMPDDPNHPPYRLIKVFYRKTYGKDRYYPKNMLGMKLTALMRRESFTKDDFEKLTWLGYYIEIHRDVDD